MPMNAATALTALSFLTLNASGQVQVLLPAELASQLTEARVGATNSQVAFEPAQYQVQHELTHFRVEVRVPFEVVRAGEMPVPVFGLPVYLQESKIEPAESARLVTTTNRLGLFAHRAGPGSL